MLEPDSEARGLATSDAQRSSIDEAPRRSEPSVFFLGSGLMFMFGALLFFGIAAYQLATFDRHPSAALYQLMSHPSRGVDTSGPISDREKMDIVEALTLTFIAPLLEITCAIVCAVIGVHLLKAAGAVTRYVIPPHDYQLLAPAIRDGNEQAISEYIRLSSLSGISGTFTKIGLTGLPLATIALTVILGAMSLVDMKFYDLAQLTLGAFIGSYVQKRTETVPRSADANTPPKL